MSRVMHVLKQLRCGDSSMGQQINMFEEKEGNTKRLEKRNSGAMSNRLRVVKYILLPNTLCSI